mgnify:CR=1 FL=1
MQELVANDVSLFVLETQPNRVHRLSIPDGFEVMAVYEAPEPWPDRAQVEFYYMEVAPGALIIADDATIHLFDDQTLQLRRSFGSEV